MSARAYMLLDIIEEKSADAIQTLKNITGVTLADTLEGHPNILLMLEAADRQKLVELVLPVLNIVDRLSKDLHLLMNRDKQLVPCILDSHDTELILEHSLN
jgi:hypothetical protein